MSVTRKTETSGGTDVAEPREARGPLCVRGRVVVAESASGTRTGIGKLMLAQGFTVVECTNASDVVPLAKTHQPDVLFLDAGMKRLDAGECVRVLERFEGTRSVVVVLTCPRDFDASAVARLEATGALLVLVKPLSRDGVLQAFHQALAESHRRKRKYESPARRKPGATRPVPGNNSLLVKRLLCPFHSTPVPVDRYVLRTGKIQTEQSFFDLPIYTSPVPGAHYVDYHLLGVATCPKCLFSSNNPAYFLDGGGDRRTRSQSHTAATRDAVAAAADARRKLLGAGGLPTDFFSERRCRASAMLAYELAIHSGRTLHDCRPHSYSVELLRLGNCHLRLALLHEAARTGNDVRLRHYTAAYEWLQKAFGVLDGPELYKSAYQLVALALSFGDDRTAYQYLTRLREMESAPVKAKSGRAALDRYLNRAQRAWEDRAGHRFPWVIAPGPTDGSLANAA